MVRIQNIKQGIKEEKENASKNANRDVYKMELDRIQENITSGIAINLECDFCEGPIFNKPKVLKFADIERFFCCSSCKSGYVEKYQGKDRVNKKKV